MSHQRGETHRPPGNGGDADRNHRTRDQPAGKLQPPKQHGAREAERKRFKRMKDIARRRAPQNGLQLVLKDERHRDEM